MYNATTTENDTLPTEYKFTYIQAKESSGNTQPVPSPTEYIYVASPMTQLPYKTTSSWSSYPTADLTSPPSARTVRATFSATPNQIYPPSEFQEDNDPIGKKLPIIIGAIIGAVLLILIIALLIWIFVFRKKDKTSSDISIEMAEETILNLDDTSTNIITKDNPLWTTSVMGDTDDPFQHDFEEHDAVGFFTQPQE